MNECKLTECQGKPRCDMCVKMDRAYKALWPDMPKEPPPGLLMSMAIRFDHGLGVPGHYDQFRALAVICDMPPGPTHAERLESTLRTMRQLYEEVSGYGFYSKAQEAEYAARAGRHEPPNVRAKRDTTA
jgi:hypothetical protein